MILLCHLPLANCSTPQILWIVLRFFMPETVFSLWQDWTSLFILSCISIHPFSSIRKHVSSHRAFREPSSLSHFTSISRTALTKEINFLNFCSPQLHLIYSRYGFITLVVHSTSVDNELSLSMLHFMPVSSQFSTSNITKSFGKLLTHPKLWTSIFPTLSLYVGRSGCSNSLLLSVFSSLLLMNNI